MRTGLDLLLCGAGHLVARRAHAVVEDVRARPGHGVLRTSDRVVEAAPDRPLCAIVVIAIGVATGVFRIRR